MTFWWKCGSSPTHHTSPTEVEGIDFGDPAAENLIGLWDFTSGADNADTGLADGIAQDGNTFGDATTSSDALRLDGNGHFDTSGADDPFDLSQGTIMVQFSQDHHVGWSPDTIVSRGEYCDRDAEGYFNIQVTAQGAVTVSHYSGEELSLSTSDGFFSAGDEVRVAYSWDENGTGTFVVENVTTGETHSEEFDSTGLSMDIGDNDDENFTFGARESDDGTYDQHFDGHIDYVAIFDTDVINSDGDGIVEGTDGDDLIDIAYTGDPDGDMIDNNDALLDGEVGDDDIVVAGAGTDTVLAGAGNDEVFGGTGDDTLDGGTGDDIIYGDNGPSGALTTGDLIVNGSFEDTTGMTSTSYGYVSTGTITGWTSADPTQEIDVHNDGRGGVAPADGNNWVDLEASPGNIALEQTVEGAVTGENYTLTFSAGEGTYHTGNTVDIYWGDELVASIDPTDGGMQEYTYTVVGGAGDGSNTLSFVGTGGAGDSRGASIDNVSLVGPIADVEGEGGHDTITGGTGDDTVYAGEGNDEITDEEGSDTVYGEAGDDFIDVSGPNSGPNTFDDIVADPSILGDAGLDDTPLPDGVPYDSLQDANPTDDIDYVDGGDGDDTIITGDDADTVFGGAGNDTIYSGIDDDTVYGGDGDDIIIDVQGSDIVDGGAGDDYINVGTDTFSDYVGDDPALPNGLYPYATDQNTADGQDIVHGGEGNDTILTGDDADIVYGEQGDDIIDAGIDDDEVYGGSGNDTITGGHGSDIIYGGSGDDIINAGDVNGVMNHTDETDDTDPVPTNDMDYVRGGDGNDTITGGDDADTLYGDAGDDYLDGGIDDDYLSGGAGADTIIGGQGNDTLVSDNDDDIDILDAGEGDDTLFVGTNDVADAGAGDDTATVRGENATLNMGDGDDFVTVKNDSAGADIMGGAGRDTFDINNAPGTVADPSTMTIDGGSEGDDYDVLDLTGSVVDNGSFEVNITGPDSNGNGFDGVVTYFDESGDVTGTLEFSEIENVIPCFTPGTMIATPKGERDVSQLVVGDKIITRDNGLQAIRWIGRKTLSAAELMLRKELYPVMIRQGALGNGLPERDMMVSPNHRMLVASEKASLYFDDHEVLVAAKHLTKMDGVELMGTQSVTYIHMMFDRHEVILSDGTWSESFQPGDFTLAGIGEDQREEIFSLFPELREQSGRGHYETARRVLRKHEAELLVS